MSAAVFVCYPTPQVLMSALVGISPSECNTNEEHDTSEIVHTFLLRNDNAPIGTSILPSKQAAFCVITSTNLNQDKIYQWAKINEGRQTRWE